MAFKSIITRMNRIQALNNGQSFPQLVECVEKDCVHTAPCHRDHIDFLLRHRRLWMVHRGFRKQPCLYNTLLCLAFEIMSNNDLDVNVYISVDGLVRKDAHCWLTRNGLPVYMTKGSNETNSGEFLCKKGRIKYWIRNAKVEPLKKILDNNLNIR